ncbi:MAG: hypothetical protein HY789_15585 [Deltaproteobacteria bacterium]|nr:hypothetical protein [Deltaproteobacteria bacterium]
MPAIIGVPAHNIAGKARSYRSCNGSVMTKYFFAFITNDGEKKSPARGRAFHLTS